MVQSPVSVQVQPDSMVMTAFSETAVPPPGIFRDVDGAGEGAAVFQGEVQRRNGIDEDVAVEGLGVGSCRDGGIGDVNRRAGAVAEDAGLAVFTVGGVCRQAFRAAFRRQPWRALPLREDQTAFRRRCRRMDRTKRERRMRHPRQSGRRPQGRAA